VERGVVGQKTTKGRAQLTYRQDLKNNGAEFDVGRKYRRMRVDHNVWQIFRCNLAEEKSGVYKNAEVSAG
jgi:hypothetical protein